MTFSGLRMAINYGLNRVRFIAPVPSGRGFARASHRSGRRGDGRQRSGHVGRLPSSAKRGDKPCCVAGVDREVPPSVLSRRLSSSQISGWSCSEAPADELIAEQPLIG